MDKSLIWLLVPGTLAIFYYVWVSAKYRYLSYDLVEYLLAGKRLSSGRFILATTTVSLLGLMSLPHMGLFYRSGFSYGFAALAAIIVPLTSALFARRVWILGRIFSPLTSAQLLGDYYRSDGLRSVTAMVALLVALVLTIMSLRFGVSLMEGLLGAGALTSLLTMGLMAALLFFHAAYGGMGAILRVAAPAGIALVLALITATLVCIDALGGIASFFDHLTNLQGDLVNAALFAPGSFYDPLPAAAPTNMSWPGTMVATSLLALMGLALTPSAMMISFTAAKGRAHAPQQFFAAALMSGLVLFSTTIIIALAARLSHKIPGIAAQLPLAPPIAPPIAPLSAGSEPQAIISLLLATPLGNPLLLGFITFALLAGIVASTSAALLSAGGIVANDIFYEKLRRSHQPTFRKSITRAIIALLLGVSLVISWQKPDDPLPLFLLAGAFGLQLLPALLGLCYAPSLSAQAVRNGALAGMLGVVATSTIPQGLGHMSGIDLPFDAWPLSLHPAFWGLAANFALLLLTGLVNLVARRSKLCKQSRAHQMTYHVLPDGKPLMAPYARIWWLLALLVGALFVLTIALPLVGFNFAGIDIGNMFPAFMPPLWIWQILSWIIGLALVYITAYKLQPIFDPEQALDGSLDPLRRRFRVKAQSRKRV